MRTTLEKDTGVCVGDGHMMEKSGDDCKTQLKGATGLAGSGGGGTYCYYLDIKLNELIQHTLVFYAGDCFVLMGSLGPLCPDSTIQRHGCTHPRPS